jgi:hypothetical protein
MEAKRPQFSAETRTVAVEFWRAQVPLKKIRDQLQMSASTLKSLLAHAGEHPDLPVKLRKMGSGMKNL